MNIKPDIFDYLQTTALEPHDDYTSQITYKDQKIIWNRLKQQEKQLNKQKEVLDKIKERHWKTRRNYVEDLTKLYDKLSEILEEIE